MPTISFHISFSWLCDPGDGNNIMSHPKDYAFPHPWIPSYIKLNRPFSKEIICPGGCLWWEWKGKRENTTRMPIWHVPICPNIETTFPTLHCFLLCPCVPTQALEKPLKMGCGIWHQDVSRRSFKFKNCNVEPPRIWLVYSAHPTEAWSNLHLGNLKA